MAVEIMTLKDKIEIAAEALYQSRNLRTWKTLQYHRPDIAEIYRENARVMIGAIEEAQHEPENPNPKLSQAGQGDHAA